MSKMLALLRKASVTGGHYKELELFDMDRKPIDLGGPSVWKLLDLSKDFDFSTPWVFSSTSEDQLTGQLWEITVPKPAFGIFWMSGKGHVNSSNGSAGFTLRGSLTEKSGQMPEYSINGISPMMPSGSNGDMPMQVNQALAPPNLPYQPVVLVPGYTYTTQLFGHKYTADVTKLTELAWGLLVCPDATMVEAVVNQ
jgi:hypothetical protein